MDVALVYNVSHSDFPFVVRRVVLTFNILLDSLLFSGLPRCCINFRVCNTYDGANKRSKYASPELG